MEIIKAQHKAYLYSLFLINTPQGRQQRNFPIGQLMDAASSAKKLLEGSEQKDNTAVFTDGVISLNAEEWVLLKELFKEVQEAPLRDAETIAELKALFEL